MILIFSGLKGRKKKTFSFSKILKITHLLKHNLCVIQSFVETYEVMIITREGT